MTRTRVLVVVGAVATLAATGVILAQDKNPPSPEAPGDFGRKVVQITNKGDDASSPLLEKVEVKRIGDRWFVSGVSAVEWGGSAKGVWMWTPLDQVSRVIGYDSIEHYQKVFADRDRRRQEYEHALKEYEDAVKAGKSKPQPKE
jgi:hypothetical protein